MSRSLSQGEKIEFERWVERHAGGAAVGNFGWVNPNSALAIELVSPTEVAVHCDRRLLFAYPEEREAAWALLVLLEGGA